MQILAMEKPGTNAAPIPPAMLKAEASHAWELHMQGIVREMWFTMADHRAVLLLECDSEVQAADLLAGLPLVRDGYIRFEILALQPYDGFARLFAATRE